MPERYFKNEYIEMYIEKGILKAIYFDDIVVDLKAAKKNVSDRIKFLNGECYPTYIDARKVIYWTEEARKFHETNTYGMKATALHVGSHVMKTIFMFYIMVHSPNVPQSCFTDEAEAMNWLEQFR